MASVYINNRLNRLLEKIDEFYFDTNELDELIHENFDKFAKTKKMNFKIKILIPDKNTPYIESAYELGKIKSHEINEILQIIKSKINNSFSSKVINYNDTFEKFTLFRKNIVFNFNSKHVYYKDTKKRNILEVEGLILNSIKYSERDFLMLAKIFLGMEALRLAESASIAFFSRKKGFVNLMVRLNLKKKLRSEGKNFLALKDKDKLINYYSNGAVMNLIFQYFYPSNDDVICKITLDKFQKSLPVKKSLRIEKYKNNYVKISEILKKNFSRSIFKDILEKNDIAGFYSGVLDVKDNLKYLLFDIDVSDFLNLIFSPAEIWTLVLFVSESMINTIRNLGLKIYPLVKFSGSRGVHIVYKYSKDVLIEDSLKRLSLKNFFYKYPGMWELIKNSKSPIKSKTSFSRLLADTIIIQMLFLEHLQIPEILSDKFGTVTNLRNFFKISSFSQNEVAILIDTIPNAAGVFRTGFSVHPFSRLVSIPIYDSGKGKFFDHALDYASLREQAKIETVLEHVQNDDEIARGYSQIHKCLTIRKEDIEYLLRPDKLLPVFAILLRFGTRFTLIRSIYSFKYWYDYYQTKFLFEYVQKMVIRCDTGNEQKIFDKIIEVSKNCNIVNFKNLKEILHDCLITKKTCVPVFIDRLKGLYHFEFYYRISPSILSFEDKERLIDIISNKEDRLDFINKLKDIHLIILGIISVDIRHIKELSKRRKVVLKKLSLHLHRYERKIEEYKKIADIKEKKLDMILCILNLILLYNIFINFLKEYFTFTKIK